MKNETAKASLVTCITERKEDFYRLAYSYVKNKDDALDIVQESIQKALTSVESVKNPDVIKSWFYKILVRTAIDFLRKQKKLKVMDDETIEFLSRGKEDHYKDTDLHEALDDLKLEEIADITGENINTVKTRLYRGLKLMRIQLTKEDLS